MASPTLGEIRIFAGAYAPPQWAFCDGSLLLISDNPALFALLGNAYGGDGLTTFAAPDLRGRLPVGMGSGPGLTPRDVLGQKLGEGVVRLTSREFPPHTHSFNVSTAPATATSPVGAVYAQAGAHYWNYIGSSDPSLAARDFAADMLSSSQDLGHSNMMPSLSLSFIIATSGTFPSQTVPMIQAITPATGPANIASAPQVVIAGEYFSASPSVTFGGQPAQVVAGSAGSVTAIPPPGTGRVPVVVSTSTGQPTVPTAGAYYLYLPSIFLLRPSHGPREGGQKVEIVGAGLANATQVTFGGYPASYYVRNDNMIIVNTPPGAGQVDVVVTVAGDQPGATAPATYRYAPVVSSLNPTLGPAAGGTTVLVVGDDFDSETTAYFGETKAATTYVSQTQLSAVSPPGSGVAPVSVRDSSGLYDPATVPFSYEPRVSGLVPGVGASGATVTIHGSNFDSGATVLFGEVSVTPSQILATTMTVTAPAGAGQVAVQVVTAGGTSAVSGATTFSYLPLIAALTPSAGPLRQSIPVTITGRNFGTAATVAFGATVVNLVSCADNQIVVDSPSVAEAAQVNVIVTTMGGASLPGPASLFAYDLAVTGLTPATGSPAGSTPVAIAGGGFVAGATTVIFGDTPATAVQVSSANLLTCLAPAGTGLVGVAVQVDGATSPSSPNAIFSYMPSLSSITPSQGPLAGGTVVALAGEAFQAGGTTVMFGATAATDVTVIDQFALTAKAPAGIGKVPVTVSTSGGLTPSDDEIQYVYTPGISEIYPRHGSAGGMTWVTIKGVGLKDTATVLFGEIAATQVSASDDETVTCLSPAGSGTVSVEVITSWGHVPMSPADVFTYGPTVSAVAPAGYTAGATELTITGAGFTDVLAVYLGGIACDNPTMVSATSVTATLPAGVTGCRQVQVLDVTGMSATGLNAYFNGPPLITDIQPAYSSLIRAGQIVVISGQGMVTLPTQAGNPVTFTAGSNTRVVAPLEVLGGVINGRLRVLVPSKLQGVVEVTVGDSTWGVSQPFGIVVN